MLDGSEIQITRRLVRPNASECFFVDTHRCRKVAASEKGAEHEPVCGYSRCLPPRPLSLSEGVRVGPPVEGLFPTRHQRQVCHGASARVAVLNRLQSGVGSRMGWLAAGGQGGGGEGEAF